MEFIGDQDAIAVDRLYRQFNSSIPITPIISAGIWTPARYSPDRHTSAVIGNPRELRMTPPPGL